MKDSLSEHRERMAHSGEDALALAFSTFQEASESLSRKYAGLEGKISELSRELRDRDRALASQGQFLETILKSLPSGVLVLTPGGQVLWSNPQVEKWLSPDDSELLALLRKWEIWPIAEREDPLAVSWKGRSLLIEISRVVDDENRSSGYVLIVNDVTRLREMEEEVSRDRRLRDMGEMVAMIAHELRNPLGSIELFSSLLARDAGTRGGQALEGIRSSVTSMDRLIGNLLFHTRIPNVSRSLFSGHDLLERLSSDCARIGIMRGRAGGPTVSFAVDEPSPFLVNGDEGLIYHAIFNLVTNAFQACFDAGGGSVTLSLLRSRSGGAIFFVKDNGPGIPREMREKIFDPFFTTRSKGTGLGLPIVLKIVLAHGGLLKVDSDENGSCFMVQLPGPGESLERTGGDIWSGQLLEEELR
ncbi:MAG: two-component system sensor histidine kinase NtrB [Leptospirillum sp.]|jgi:two-component system sensor histidine kinase FlrB